MFALLFSVAAFVAAANAQCFDGGVLGYTLAGPCAERYFRQAYAPVDFALGQAGMYGQYAGYGYNGRPAAVAAGAITGMAAGAGIGAAVGGNTRSALIGAGAGAAAGGLLTYAVTRGANREQAFYDSGFQGREVRFAEPKAQKPLDCRKPAGKRGKNEVACAAAERQACLAELAASPWQLQNGSDRFTFTVTESGQPFLVCGEPVVIRPHQTIYIFPPAGQIGGIASGAAAGGKRREFAAKVQAVNRPGFIGFVLLAPGAPEGGN